MNRIVRACARAAATVGVMASLVAPVNGAEPIVFEDILGKWCGEITNYVFTREKLTVYFHSGGTRELRIQKINPGTTWLDLHWRESGNTVFGDFTPDKNVMFQFANTTGDKGPRRRFRRC